MRSRALLTAAALACALAATAPPAAADSAPVPTGAQCAAVRAHRTLAPVEAYDPRPGAVRVFAIQYKQDLANVVSYTAFRTKIECLIRQDVLPRLARGRPNLVVFPEDTGLMTLATGSRGAEARRRFGGPGAPGCESQGAPCSTVAALGAITAAYGPQVAAYKARFPSLGPLAAAFVAATDTLVRSFMETFSDLARRYGIYIVASNDQAPFTTSSDPVDVALFRDPDQPPPASVYVATSPDVHNEAFLWGPEDVRATGPAPLRNVVASNLKVPLTPIELELGLTPGPSSGPAAIANLRPYALPGTAARLGLATSLPAFIYGSPPPGTDPCSDTSLYYMRCLDRLGANVVLQDEANPGRWTGPDADPREQWQPLSWMGSAYRAVSDPTVHFAYDVNPMMTGNLADLPFDGQTAITQRGLSGPGCHYIGNTGFLSGEDRPDLAAYAGPQPDFLALAPWVSPDGSRTQLRRAGAQLAPGSGSPLENDYAETAAVADLPIPADARRPGCAAGPAPTHAQPPRRHHRRRHDRHHHRHPAHRRRHDRAPQPGRDRLDADQRYQRPSSAATSSPWR
ncbi:MAG: hypothetical protein ACR2GZ_02450 [Solirubrobacteraceae bacterium]